MPVVPSQQALASGWRWFRWRAVVLVAVFALALAAFLLGVGVSDRDGLPAADLATKVYYALGLFVFGGLDLGVPQGGPPWGRMMLWAAYFLAPAITTSALVEGVLRAIRPRAWRLRRIRDHTIVVGCGRLGMLYLEGLRRHRAKDRLLVVERQAGHASTDVAAARYRAEILIGDVTSEAVLNSLRLAHAHRVALLTGDDFVNLDTAARILKRAPHLSGEVLAHVADLRLQRVLAGDGDRSARLLPGCAVFNSHHTAAAHLVRTQLLPRFRSTAGTDHVVLAGFGRFGQTVLGELQRQALGKFGKVIILDLVAELRARVFAEQIGFDPSYRHLVVEGDLRDPESWQKVRQRIDCAEEELVTVLGSNEPGINIRTALWLAGRMPAAHVVARCFYSSSFTEQISAEGGFEVVSSADLLLTSLERQWDPESQPDL